MKLRKKKKNYELLVSLRDDEVDGSGEGSAWANSDWRLT